MQAFLAAQQPKRGSRGKELHRHVTANDSATMPTAHGGLQGDNGHALGAENYHVIVQAEAFGNGQEDGHVAPMLAGATANGQAIGVPETSFEGKVLSAASNAHSDANLATCAQEKLDAYIPATHVRQREPRCAPQERHNPHLAEKCTLQDFLYDNEQECSRCPHGKV